MKSILEERYSHKGLDTPAAKSVSCKKCYEKSLKLGMLDNER
jgi:hypothetical protein